MNNNVKLIKQLHDRNYQKFGLDMNPFVSIVSAILVLGFSFFTIAQPDKSAAFFSGIKSNINTNFNWLFVLTVNFVFLFTIYLAASKFGKIKLGGPSTKPEFSKIFTADFLFADDEKYTGTKPLRTFIGSQYKAGFSDHLPIILDLYYK